MENNEPSDNVKTIDFLTHEHKTALIEETLKKIGVYTTLKLVYQKTKTILFNLKIKG